MTSRSYANSQESWRNKCPLRLKPVVRAVADVGGLLSLRDILTNALERNSDPLVVRKVDRNSALSIGTEFGQTAIVVGRVKEPPELFMLA